MSLEEHDRVYADDLAAGQTIQLGSRTLTQEEIIEFATAWDPHGFHVDESVAEAGFFGGIIASGIHSMAVYQRLAVDGALRHWAVIAGRTMTDVQMTKPVRAGMELSASMRIDRIEHRGPRRSLVHKTSFLTHADDPVLTFNSSLYMHRRPTSAAEDYR